MKYKIYCFIIKFIFVGSILFSTGCVSSVIYNFSGNTNGESPKHRSEYQVDQTIRTVNYPEGIGVESIFVIVNQSLSNSLKISDHLDKFNKYYSKNKKIKAYSMKIVKFSGASNHYFKGKSDVYMMMVGCSLMVFEILDPFILPHAIYAHIKSYQGERYFSVFFNKNGAPVMLFNFNILTGEQSISPKYISNCHWCPPKEVWFPNKNDKDNYFFSYPILTN